MRLSQFMVGAPFALSDGRDERCSASGWSVCGAGAGAVLRDIGAPVRSAVSDPPTLTTEPRRPPRPAVPDVGDEATAPRSATLETGATSANAVDTVAPSGEAAATGTPANVDGNPSVLPDPRADVCCG